MKVLIVEDDEFLQRAMLARLKTFKHFEVQIVSDGEEAEYMVREFEPDLILLDIIMPKRDGFTFLRWLRKHKKFATIKVIVITNLSGFQHIIQAKKLGVTDYFEKASFRLKDITNRMEVYANA